MTQNQTGKNRPLFSTNRLLLPARYSLCSGAEFSIYRRFCSLCFKKLFWTIYQLLVTT